MIPAWLRVTGLVSGMWFAGQALAGNPVRLVQSDGSELILPAPAERIITLAPGLTEMIFAAGAGRRLVATVEFSNFPAAASKLPRIGDAFRFDLEKIVSLKPDLVMAWTSGNPAAALERLDSLGLPTWRIEMTTPGEIGPTLRMITVATGNDPAGIGKAAELERRAEGLRAKYAGRETVRYFYQVAQRPLYTLNGDHIVSRGLALCGGENVFAGQPVIAPQISREAVLLADPQVIFAPVLDGQEDPLQHWRDWPRLQAVMSGSLYGLPADEISRATPRLLDSLELACNLLDQFRSG